MFFVPDEKVFSVSKAVHNLPVSNITSLIGEFYAFLLVSGLYLEAAPWDDGSGYTVPEDNDLSGKMFSISSYSGDTGYNWKLSQLLSKGLKERYDAILRHPDLTSQERTLFELFDDVFGRTGGYLMVTGEQIYNTALRRGVEGSMLTVAYYTAMAFGHKSFPKETTLPALYLSMFGNIHLSEECSYSVTSPVLEFGKKEKSLTITPFWALMSSICDSFTTSDSGWNYAGTGLADAMSNYSFISDPSYQKNLCFPHLANVFSLEKRMGITDRHSPSLGVKMFKAYMFGDSIDRFSRVGSLRKPLFLYILDHMKKKTTDVDNASMFAPSCPYARLIGDTDNNPCSSSFDPIPLVLDYALESLSALDDIDKSADDSEDKDTEGKTGKTDKPTVNPKSDSDSMGNKGNSDEDPDNDDPADDTNGFDPGATTPSEPASATGLNENTIGPISFDKTGEGVAEVIYRQMVVALNDRLQCDDDDDLVVDRKTRENLDYWVNGFLFKTAISDTKAYISVLGLQKYLKED